MTVTDLYVNKPHCAIDGNSFLSRFLTVLTPTVFCCIRCI